MGSVAAEVERDPTAEPDIAASTPGSSMLERWIESGDDRALKRIDVLVKTLDHLRAASIRMTYPSDWIIHTSTDADGNILRQVGYLQDCGADRAGKAWGIQLTEPSEEIERFPENKTFAYRLKADAWSKVTGERLERVLGSRWSGDKFFTRGLEEGEQVDPTDVAKAAYANLHGRAVRALAGLGAVPLDVLKAAGLDVEKVMFVGYSKGSKGGQSTGAGVGTADFVISWGNSKGKRPAEISDKDLAYYIRKAEENLADPSKQRFKQKTEHELAALRAETERRAKSAEQETVLPVSTKRAVRRPPATKGAVRSSARCRSGSMMRSARATSARWAPSCGSSRRIRARRRIRSPS
jgi:hypothetical protein